MAAANEDEVYEEEIEVAKAPVSAAAAAESSGENVLGMKEGFYDVRCAVVGNVDSGKSTLVGVLTGGQLDNGRGLARSRVFVHSHEAANGRTSCISQHIVGFGKDREMIYQSAGPQASSAQKTKSWNAIVQESRSVLTLIDLAGHERYLKTTIAGLTGCFPDYAIIVINGLAGVTKMTKEHLGVVLALKIPLICVVTKVDMTPENVLQNTHKQLFKILKSSAAKKVPMLVKSIADVDTCIASPVLKIAPVFFISSVTGKDLDLLTNYLGKLAPRQQWQAAVEKPVEFSIDETFNVTGVGIVISGTCSAGTLRTNSTLLLGPAADGTFRQVFVRSLQCKRQDVDFVRAGDNCAVALRAVKRKDPLKRTQIRRGMVLIDEKADHRVTRFFEAEVLVLHHPTTIKKAYQAVVHCGIIRQTAVIIHIDKDQECLRTGDRATVRFAFMQRPELMHEGTTFIFREGNTKGIGRISKLLFDYTGFAHDLPLGCSLQLQPQRPGKDAAAAGASASAAVAAPSSTASVSGGGDDGDSAPNSVPAGGTASSVPNGAAEESASVDISALRLASQAFSKLSLEKSEATGQEKE